METMTAPKERPILFSTDMVQAILEGRKTQTRRKCKSYLQVYKTVNRYPKPKWFVFENDSSDWESVKCPYGQPGELLWVRESIYAHPAYSSAAYHEGLCGPLFGDDGEAVAFRGYMSGIEGDEMALQKFRKCWKIIPSIHMPKEAARIWLEITDVRVERVQDISKEDAVAEGVQKITVSGTDHWKRYDGYQLLASSPVVSFWSLWAMINGEDSWDKNPLVWVVSFKVISTTGKPSSVAK